MQNELKKMREEAIALLQNVREPAQLEDLRLRFLGKKGQLTSVLRQMGKLSADERPAMGQLANDVRASIEEGIDNARKKLGDAIIAARLTAETVDVTTPGIRRKIGHRHLLTKTLEEVTDIFLGMGFVVAEGPEVELDYYNFEALNMPKEHPARDTQDTFYFSENMLLRTQTSSVQIRYMENNRPPIRMICPGAVYRSDEVDATHSPVFHQIEGLVVDKGITMANLKGTLQQFAQGFYSPDTAVRFRPHHFPYTEPSAEMDVQCFACHGSGCRLCKGEGWIEILGCGMVHPQVLRNMNIDPDVYSGFAFGMGQERLAILRYEIDDMRLLFENDTRFLSQF